MTLVHNTRSVMHRQRENTIYIEAAQFESTSYLFLSEKNSYKRRKDAQRIFLLRIL